MLNEEFVEKQRVRLEKKLESKHEILKRGGERAHIHSRSDVIRIEFAISRIKNGQYGLCTNCGHPIGEKRLATIPETPFCSGCAIFREEGNDSRHARTH